MPFGNPVVGGTQLVRNAIASPGYVPHNNSQGVGQGWSINRDGSADFANVNSGGQASGSSAVYNDIAANKTFNYKGQELSDILWALPKGIIAYGSIPGATDRPVQASGTPVTPFLELGVTTYGQRNYRFWMNPIRVTGNSAGLSITGLFTRTTDGTQPTAASPQIFADQFTIAFGSNTIYYTLRPQTILSNSAAKGTSQQWRMMFSVQLQQNGAYQADLNYEKIEFFIEDVGPLVPDTGLNRYNNTPPPTTRYDQTWYNIAAQTYQANGTPSIATNANRYGYQGDGTAVGNPGGEQYGYFFFDTTSIQTALAGASIISTYVAVNNLHCYLNSGIETAIGTHPHGSNPPAVMGANNLWRWSLQCANGGGATTGDLGPGLGQELQAATTGGIVLGAATLDLNHYGYYNVVSIRVIYQK